MSIQRRIGIQKLSREMDDEELSGADWEGGYDGMIGLAREASARITALEAENAKLREALGPFAGSPYSTIDLRDLGDSDPDTHLICEGVTITDMRRAAATLSQIDKPKGTD